MFSILKEGKRLYENPYEEYHGEHHKQNTPEHVVNYPKILDITKN